MSIHNQPQEPLSIKPQAQPQPQTDPHLIEMLVQQRRDNQNLGLGILGGAAGALAGAVLWALITWFTNFQIGFMAVGVGLLTGFGVRKFGQGIDKSFGVAGAVLSLAGCLAGNLFVLCIAASKEFGVSFFEILASIRPSLYVEMLTATFSAIDLVFYAIAVYEGYKFSIVRLTEADLTR